ncbi:hypothetical protein ACO0SA_000616 [Hanseniaspora valbyensis]
MSDLDTNINNSDLNNFLSSYFQLDNITKINYNQYIGTNGNEQWCFQSDLYLRSRDNKNLVSLFSKELWCFSLNDDPVPLPYEKGDNFETINDFSFIDPDVIDSNIIQERIPDKVGHFTPNFAKPNLPTPYAIFLKAVRRLIYLNLCSLSLNKYIPFGNSSLVEDSNTNNGYKILNFSPHLFEDGSLSVSINYKNLKLISLKKIFEKKNENNELNKSFLDSYAVYIAPSSVKCMIKFDNDMLDSCISKKPPRNSDKILKILNISHGLDLINRKDEIKWIKVIPSILHLSGQTPPISAFLQDIKDDNNNNNNNSSTILWPLDLVYLQKSDISSYKCETEQVSTLNIDETFQMIQEISNLNAKLTLNNKPEDENNLISNDEEFGSDFDAGINTNIPSVQVPMTAQQSSPFMMSMNHGSPDKLNPITKSMFSMTNIPNGNNNSVNTDGNQMTSPLFRLKSMENSPAFGFIEKELFKNTDPNKSIDDIMVSENEDIKQDSIPEEMIKSEEEKEIDNKDDDSNMDVDDEMRDLFGDDDEEEEEEEEGNDKKNNNGEISVHESESQNFDSKQTNDSSMINGKKTIGKKRGFNLIEVEDEGPKSTGYSYSDPGAPVPTTITPSTGYTGNNTENSSGTTSLSRERRSSVYSHINFNPLIDSVDSKYKQGGKFAMSHLKNTVNDHLFNDNSNIVEDNECAQDDINLKEIMLQATRKIKQDGSEEVDGEDGIVGEDANGSDYNDEISSDEDDNGMISIRDITSTNPSIPITSISHHNHNNHSKNNSNGINHINTSNNLEGYQSLPYTNIFTNNNNNNNNNSVKDNGNFPLSVINEIKNNNIIPKDLKNMVYPLSAPSSGILNEPSNQNNLLSGNELYKNQLQTKSLASALITTNNSISTNNLNQYENNNADLLDNLMAKISSPTLSKHGTSTISPDGNQGKNFINEMILSNGSKVSTSPLKKEYKSPTNINNNGENEVVVEEEKNINVLPFVLRHMPVFSIPFHFYTDPSNNISGVNSDLFLEVFERELVFNSFKSIVNEDRDALYEQENSFFESIDEIENVFQRLFPMFERLKLGKDLLASDKLLSDIHKEGDCSNDDKCIVVNDYDGKELLISNDVLKNWFQFGIKPISEKNEIPIIYSCFINTFKDENLKMFMNNFKYTYESKKLGEIKFINENEHGIFTLDSFDNEYLTILPLKILQEFVGITKKTNILVILPIITNDTNTKNDIVSKLKFFTNLKEKITEKLPLLSLNLQLVPKDKISFIKLGELNQMALSIFNKVNISQKNPETYFAKLLPKSSASFKNDITQHNYSVPIVTNSNVPYFNVPKSNKFDNYIIVSYSRSIDKKYITASWVLPDGTNFDFKTWKLDDSSKFEKVCDEIWSKTIGMIPKYSKNLLIGDSNCIILTRLNSILPDDELMHWRRLSSKNKNVSLAVVCVGLNRCSNDNLSVSTTSNVPEKDIHFTVFKNSLPLSNSQHRCSIKTGAIIKNFNSKYSYKNLTGCDYLEINLLNCPHSSSTILLEIIMWQYYELSLLNPSFGISNQSVIPFNLLIIQKVLNKVIHLDI